MIEETVVSVRAVPGARREGIRYDPWARAWVIAVTAPARGGEANRAIVELIAKRLDLPASDLEWVGGTSSRRKRLRVRGLAPAEVDRRLGHASSLPG